MLHPALMKLRAPVLRALCPVTFMPNSLHQATVISDTLAREPFFLTSRNVSDEKRPSSFCARPSVTAYGHSSSQSPTQLHLTVLLTPSAAWSVLLVLQHSVTTFEPMQKSKSDSLSSASSMALSIQTIAKRNSSFTNNTPVLKRTALVGKRDLLTLGTSGACWVFWGSECTAYSTCPEWGPIHAHAPHEGVSPLRGRRNPTCSPHLAVPLPSS